MLLTLSFAGKHAEPGGILSNLCCFNLLLFLIMCLLFKVTCLFKKKKSCLYVFNRSQGFNNRFTLYLFPTIMEVVSYQKEKKETTCDLIITVECIWAVV